MYNDEKWLKEVDTSVLGGSELNESVSIVLEASCSTAYFSVPSLDLVEKALWLMDSTLDGYHRWFDAYIFYFLSHLSGLDSCGCIDLLCTSVLQFGKEINQGFTAFCGILVVMWISIVSFSVIQFILCLCVPSSLLFYITKWIKCKG